MIDGENISLLNNDAGYITSYSETDPTLNAWTGSTNINSLGTIISGVWNGSPVTSSYIQDGTISLSDIGQNSCSNGQTIKWNNTNSIWECGSDNNSISNALWGSITGDLVDQSDISEALLDKLNIDDSFGGDLSGTYDSITISDDSHTHTGLSISGLSNSNFTVENVSQWSNDAGYITGLDNSQIANGAGIYWNYKPNDLACAQDQILKYSTDNNGWVCGDDNSSNVGGDASGETIIIADNLSPSGLTLDDTINFTTTKTGDYLLYVSTSGYLNVSNQEISVDAEIDGINVGSTNGYINVASSHTVISPIIVKVNNLIAGEHSLKIIGSTNINVDLVDRIHAYIQAVSVANVYGTIDWSGIQNRPAGLDDGDNVLSESDVEDFITNSIIDLAVDSTLGTNLIATQTWVNGLGFLTGIPDGTVSLSGIGQSGCTDGQIIKWSDVEEGWVCGDESTSGGQVLMPGQVASVNTVQTREQGDYIAPTTMDGTILTPLNILFTPKQAGNKVILEWILNGEAHHNTVFDVYRNGVLLASSNDGNRWSGAAVASFDTEFLSTPNNITIKLVDENSLDIASTYSIAVRSSDTVERNYYLNRTLNTTGADGYESTMSTGVATEINTGVSVPNGSITIGSMTGPNFFSDISADDQWLGLGVSEGRLEFDNQLIDELNFLDVNVGIGTSTPSHKLDVNGTIGLSSDMYINWGSVDGETGYGLRDNNGVIEYKNNGGAWTDLSSGTTDYIILRDEKPNGTEGGDASVSDWAPRIINTETLDTGDNCVLLDNRFTLEPGTYDISAMASFYNTYSTNLRLRNITDDVTTIIGINTYAGDGTSALLNGRFTIDSSKTFEIQFMVEHSRTIYGLGVSQGQRNSYFTENEVYLNAELHKLN
jgi:hypothetical protein